MLRFQLSRFLSDEGGAVTVDWVVLTGAVVGLGLATTASVRTGVGALGDDIEASLTNATVVSLNFVGSDDGAFSPVGCEGGYEAILAYADAMYASGAWPDAGTPGTAYYDYDAGDTPSIIDETRNSSDANLIANYRAWSADYSADPTLGGSPSNMVEMAAAECAMAERGL